MCLSALLWANSQQPQKTSGVEHTNSRLKKIGRAKAKSKRVKSINCYKWRWKSIHICPYVDTHGITIVVYVLATGGKKEARHGMEKRGVKATLLLFSVAFTCVHYAWFFSHISQPKLFLLNQKGFKPVVLYPLKHFLSTLFPCSFLRLMENERDAYSLFPLLHNTTTSSAHLLHLL